MGDSVDLVCLGHSLNGIEMRASGGFDNASSVQELVFYHVLVQFEHHVSKSLRLLKFGAENCLQLVEAAVIQILHVAQPVVRFFALTRRQIGHSSREIQLSVVALRVVQLMLANVEVFVRLF